VQSWRWQRHPYRYGNHRAQLRAVIAAVHEIPEAGPHTARSMHVAMHMTCALTRPARLPSVDLLREPSAARTRGMQCVRRADATSLALKRPAIFDDCQASAAGAITGVRCTARRSLR